MIEVKPSSSRGGVIIRDKATRELVFVANREIPRLIVDLTDQLDRAREIDARRRGI